MPLTDPFVVDLFPFVVDLFPYEVIVPFVVIIFPTAMIVPFVVVLHRRTSLFRISGRESVHQLDFSYLHLTH